MQSYLSNLHTHTNFSDGSNEPEIFIKKAIDKGMESYAITDHATIPGLECKWCIESKNISKYLKTIHQLKIKYENDIEILSGFEVDYIRNVIKPSDFHNYNTDILIGSLHFIKNKNGEIMNLESGKEKFKEDIKKYFNNDLKKLITEYYETLGEMIKSGGFIIAGHVDKIKMNVFRLDPDLLNTEWYINIENKISELLAEFPGFIEINTRGMYKSIIDETYPSINMIKKIFDNGGRLVLNADTHDPEGICAYYKNVLLLLKDEKINYIYTRKNGYYTKFHIK